MYPIALVVVKICACICKKPVLVLSCTVCLSISICRIMCGCECDCDYVCVPACICMFVFGIETTENVMWVIAIDVIYPSSIESSSQFRSSCNACLLSISSCHRAFSPKLRSQFNAFFLFLLLVLIKFIHTHASLFFGGRLLNTAPVTLELKYLTNEWWCCCCCCYYALVLISIEINFHLVLFCLSTGFICSFVSHSRTQNTFIRTHFSAFPHRLPHSLCVSPLWPFRINSICIHVKTVLLFIGVNLLVIRSLSHFFSFSSLYLSVLIRIIQFCMRVLCACVQPYRNLNSIFLATYNSSPLNLY